MNSVDALTDVALHSMAWNEKELFQAPKYRIVDQKNALSLVFEGPEYLDTLREVFGYYAHPGLLDSTKVHDTRYPAVLLLHGAGGRAFKHWAIAWAEKGYAALAIDLSARDGLSYFNKPHGPKANRKTRFSHVEKGVDHLWQTFAVSASIKAHSLLLSLPEVDSQKTAITGISWGGYLTCMTIALDHRFKAACPVYGCGFLSECSGPKKRLETLPERDRQTWFRALDPKYHLTETSCHTLFINGNKDFYFDIYPFQKTADLVRPDLRQMKITPDLKHDFRHGSEQQEIEAFFNEVVLGKKVLPKVFNPIISDSIITISYRSPSPLVDAVFFSCHNTDVGNKERTWKNVAGQIGQSSISFFNPGSDMKIGFIYLTNELGLSISSDLIVKNKSG